MLTKDDWDRIRQWFNSIQDTNKEFLDWRDVQTFTKVVRMCCAKEWPVGQTERPEFREAQERHNKATKGPAISLEEVKPEEEPGPLTITISKENMELLGGVPPYVVFTFKENQSPTKMEDDYSFTCPKCGSHWFGTSERGGGMARMVNCHGSDSHHCRWSGPAAEHLPG